MTSWLNLAVVLLVACSIVIVARAANSVTARDRVRVDVLPYSSGSPLREHALSRFHVRWYPVTIVFLAFDVEMLFMYPWAVVVAELGAGALGEMFVFLGLLMAGTVWAAREGAFRWT